MTTTPPDSARPTPAWKPLDLPQRRVLGVLVEKAKTTPAAYPMTVNAVVVGCNQKNNRDPLTALDDFDVEKALSELAALGAVSELDWLGRVPKYKHHAHEWLGVSRVELAVMTELLLRGAQALGELRGRAARMEPIADLAELKPIVDGLVARNLIIELTPAGRGQVVSHNLYSAHELAELKARHAGPAGRPTPPDRDEVYASPIPRAESPTPPASVGAGVSAVTLAALATEITELRTEVVRLRAEVRDLEAKLTAALG